MPLYDGGRVCRDADGAAHFDAARRCPSPGLRRAEIRGAHSGQSRGARGARAVVRRFDDAVSGGQYHHPGRPAQRYADRLYARSQRSAGEGQGLQSRSIVAYRNGAPVRLQRRRAMSSTARRTISSPAGTTASARSFSRSTASPTPTRSRSSTASRHCCRHSGCRFRRLSKSSCWSTARSRSAIRSATCSSPCARPSSLVVLVIFIVPAQRDGHASFLRWRCRSRSSAPSPACMCMGYSIDNLSLMALTLSVGFVVDDAIVMLENIVRHIENGRRAAGSRASTARAKSASPFCR